MLGCASAMDEAGVGEPGPHYAGDDWPSYLGDEARTHYSTLSQIDKTNVTELQVAWTYDTGDVGQYQVNPIEIGGVLYTRSPGDKVIALDAATGRERWTWDPAMAGRPAEPIRGGGTRTRGLMVWSGDTAGRRVFAAAGNYLYCLDAETGELVPTFAENGALHLAEGLDIESRIPVALNTPGVRYRDLIIIGSNPGEAASAPPGHIRAFDVRTGERRWIFHTIPHPGELGYETWPPEYYTMGAAANSWAGMALDPARGIVYVPTGSPGGDFWGGERWGENLFANSLIALEAGTGRYLWHFQIVHHDLWDRDLPTPPVLMTVMHEGRQVDVVAQGTKQGQIFVFDRVTGEPLWPIEERPVPPAAIPGVRTWPTQPFPTWPPALVRGPLTTADASTISPRAQMLSSQRLRSAPNPGPFPGPTVHDTVFFPGYDGGMEWGGAAADPRGHYYVNVNEIAWGYQLVPTYRDNGMPTSLGERTYLIQCAACHGADRQGEPASGIPPLVGVSEQYPKDTVTRILERGTGGRMPSFSGLNEGRRRAVVDFLYGEELPVGEYTGGRGGGAGSAGDAPPYAFRGFQRWLDEEGYPAIAPPWGTLNAVDMNTGEIRWQVPLGEFSELTARGIPPTGMENYGGPVVTASGLLFIAATGDEMIRAFDTDTGDALWQTKLPFGGFATPSTYSVNGRQFVVISAGGGKSGRPAGGSIVAFALPE
jgi:quinoprotein glucose dehydrogenase